MATDLIEYQTKEQSQIHRKQKTVEVERACELIIKGHGTVTRELLLDAARDNDHPLHDSFEWDHKVAAEKYRLAQAGAMIIATKYVAYLKSSKKATRRKQVDSQIQKAVRVRRFLPRNDGSGYVDRVQALDDNEVRKSLIERKVGVLRSWCDSVIDINELQPVRESVAAAIAGI